MATGGRTTGPRAQEGNCQQEQEQEKKKRPPTGEKVPRCATHATRLLRAWRGANPGPVRLTRTGASSGLGDRAMEPPAVCSLSVCPFRLSLALS